MKKTAHEYRPDIDGIRAIAVLSVVSFHAMPDLVTGGFVGVDVFFVISGYLITGIILNQQHHDRFSILDFYFRRARRIFPALLIVLTTCLLFGWFALLPTEYQQLGRHASAGALFFANFVFWGEAGYFDIQSNLKPLLHLWSLGIEEQFYIVWPVVLLAIFKRESKAIVPIFMLALVSFTIGEVLVHQHSAAAFYLPASRVWELMFGCALAHAEQYGLLGGSRHTTHWVFGTRLAECLSIAGLSLIFAAATVFDKDHNFPGWRALIPTLGTALLIAAGPTTWVNRSILGNKALVLVGLISYPLYLWHWPLLSLARILESGDPGPVIKILAVTVAFMLACITYIVVERPIRLRPAKSLAPSLFTLILLVALAGYVIDESGGVPARIVTYQEQLSSIKWALETDENCQKAVPVKSRYCRISNIHRAPTAAVIGDSHANRLFDGLSQHFIRNDGNLLQLGEGGCLPFWDVRGGAVGSGDSCLERMNGQLDYIVNAPTIKTVILSSRGPLYISGVGFGEVEKDTRTFLRYDRHGGNLTYGDIYSMALRETLIKLLEAKKQVLFIIDNPELGFNPLSCIRTRPIQLTNKIKTPCAVPRSAVVLRNSEYKNRLELLAKEFPAVTFVDTHKVLCDSEYCWAMKDGILLYMDGDHLNRHGTALIAKEMPSEIFRPDTRH